MGQVITFYSYKGGVGRTMALTNVATLLAKWGYKTLIVDWDLEAPGLEFYFQDFIDIQAVTLERGLVNFFDEAERGLDGCVAGDVDWKEAVIEIEIPNAEQSLHLITAGQRDKSGSYFNKVTALDWASFYEKKGGFLIEQLRQDWKASYDYVLIDSRTGITDIGGICTIQLPDVLVLLFTANEQSLGGVIDVANKAQAARWDLPFDRASLLCLPIPSRFDSGEEFKISQEWLSRFSQDLEKIYDDWLPRTVEKKRFLEVTKIPYSSYFSFGEKLPVIEQGTTDPAGLGYAYENLATIISDGFESVEELLGNRDRLVNEQSHRKSKLRIFIAHTDKDAELAKEIYSQLRKDTRYQPWSHSQDIFPGQNWRKEITSAIAASDVILVCLSEQSVVEEDYEQREFDTALSLVGRALSLSDFLPNKSTQGILIPVKFDSFDTSDIPQWVGLDLDDFYWLNYGNDDFFDTLADLIERHQAGTLPAS